MSRYEFIINDGNREEWRQCSVSDAYEVSSLGRVRDGWTIEQMLTIPLGGRR